MTKTLPIGLTIAAMVLVLVFSPLTQHHAIAMEDKTMIKDKEGTMMKDKTMMKKPIYMRGDLASPKDGKPFGGDVVGDYFVRITEDKVRIMATVDNSPTQGKVFEGWLVDMDTGYKLSLGKFDDRDTLFFTERMVNPSIYDLLVITEEPENDTDPNPANPIGGAQVKLSGQ